MLNPEMEREAIKTLRLILEYVNVDVKYSEYAQLISYMEWFKNK